MVKAVAQNIQNAVIDTVPNIFQWRSVYVYNCSAMLLSPESWA